MKLDWNSSRLLSLALLGRRRRAASPADDNVMEEVDAEVEGFMVTDGNTWWISLQSFASVGFIKPFEAKRDRI